MGYGTRLQALVNAGICLDCKLAECAPYRRCVKCRAARQASVKRRQLKPGWSFRKQTRDALLADIRALEKRVKTLEKQLIVKIGIWQRRVVLLEQRVKQQEQEGANA